MSMVVMRRVALAALTVPLVGPVAADDRGYRAHGAHVHGVAALNVALDGEALYLEFLSPAVNLVGFEHAPADAAERALVQEAQTSLSRPEVLFVLPEAAGCELADADIETPWTPAAAGSHGAPGPAAGAEAGHAGDHADVHAGYRFVCSRPGGIGALEVPLFDRFPMTRRLEVQYVVSGTQGAAVLTPDRRRLAF